MIKDRIKSLWRLQGGYEIMLAGCGYYMVKFDCLEDREKVIVGGPWVIQGCYHMVKRWTSDFKLEILPSEELLFGCTLRG